MQTESGLRLRQAAHQMIQAGHKYLEHGLIQHALHCYACITPLYEEGWSSVDTHVLHSLSTQLSALGADKEAGEHLLKLCSLTHPNDNKNVLISQLDERLQRIILFDLFRIVGSSMMREDKNSRATENDEEKSSATSGIKRINNMSIPTVSDPTLRTMVNENPSETSILGTGWSCIPSPEARGGKRSIDIHSSDPNNDSTTSAKRAKEWKKLISSAGWCRRGWEIMNPCTKNPDNLDYTSHKQKQQDATLPPQWCSVNEPVEIDFILKNPLDVVLCIKNITLIAIIEKKKNNDQETETPTVPTTPSLQADMLDSLLLQPNSDTVLRMRVVPLIQGILKIQGISWNLGPSEEDREGYSVKDVSKYKAKERASRNGSTVVDISITLPSFKPVALSLSRSSLSKTPKQVFFDPIHIFDSFTTLYTVS